MLIIRYVYNLLVLGTVLYALRRGYLRRRPYWSRASWLRFGATCGVCIVMIAVFLVDASGSHPAWVTSADRRSYWILGMLALMMVGAGGLSAAIGWLVVGEAARPFPGVRDQNQLSR